jgi:hypothetical protein
LFPGAAPFGLVQIHAFDFVCRESHRAPKIWVFLTCDFETVFFQWQDFVRSQGFPFPAAERRSDTRFIFSRSVPVTVFTLAAGLGFRALDSLLELIVCRS